MLSLILAGCQRSFSIYPPSSTPPLTSLATSFSFYPFPNPHQLPLNLPPPFPPRRCARLQSCCSLHSRRNKSATLSNTLRVLILARRFLCFSPFMKFEQLQTSSPSTQLLNVFSHVGAIKLALLPWSRDPASTCLSTKTFHPV